MANKPDMKGANTGRSNQQRPRSYPWWASFIIGLVVLLWAVAAYMVTSTVANTVNVARQASQPNYIAKVVERIAEIDSTLPPGFKYQLAGSMFNVHMVNLLYQPDQTSFLISSLPPGDRRDETARTLADKMADQGIPALSNEMHIEGKGSFDIAGEKLEYVLGSADDRNGEKFGGFIGCIMLENGRTVLLYGLTPVKQAAGSTEPKSTANGGAAGTQTEKSVSSQSVPNVDADATNSEAKALNSVPSNSQDKDAATDATNMSATKVASAPAAEKSADAKSETLRTEKTSARDINTAQQAKTIKQETSFNMNAAIELLSAIKKFK